MTHYLPESEKQGYLSFQCHILNKIDVMQSNKCIDDVILARFC